MAINSVYLHVRNADGVCLDRDGNDVAVKQRPSERKLLAALEAKTILGLLWADKLRKGEWK